jgi:predicted MFS family arabinose efflux permease
MAVVTLLPYAVLPPLVEGLVQQMGGYLNMLNLTALMMAPILGLCPLLGPPSGRGHGSSQDRLRKEEIWDNLRDPRIRTLLGASLLIFTAFAPVFFFVKSFAGQIGVANPGWFFTISTGMEIGVRLIGGAYFDRTDKRRMLALSLGLLVCTYAALALSKSVLMFFGLAAIMGLGWGVALPMLNSLIFDFSSPRLRPLNANLGFEMFQGGLFLGPWLGAWLLAKTSYLVLFMSCAASLGAALCLTLLLHLQAKRGPYDVHGKTQANGD